MNIYRNVVHRFPFVKNIHWQLLVFLVMFLNVKLAVKFSAIVFIYLLQPDFHFDFRFRLSRLPLFYVIVIAVAVFNSIIHRQLFQVNYIAVLSTGILFWVMCILAMHQLKMITEKTNAQIIYNTLIVFFLLNTVVSAITYFSIIIETGSFNPFRYQGNYQKYFISTGDYIKGISFDTSTTNAILNAFGMVFFLWKRNWLMVFVCTLTLLFTASNFVNLAVFVLLIFLLFFKSDKDQKSVIVVCCAFLAVFMVKVSPQNNSYAVDVLSKAFHLPKPKTEQQVKKIDIREKPDDSLSTEQRKEKTALLYLDSLNRKIIPVKKDTIARIAGIDPAEEKKISIPQPSIHTPPFQRKDDTNAIRKEMMRFAEEKKEVKKKESMYAGISMPGKAIAFIQTGKYFLQHPAVLLTGTGLGNFSSKVAFKATALRFAGGFPKRLAYIHPDFALNHLSLYIYFFTEHSKKHSVTNSPNAVYDQLFSEYGVIGLLAFFIFYIGWFAKDHKKLTYGIPIMILLLGFFFTDYWFEQLSVVTFCELLLLLNLKESKSTA